MQAGITIRGQGESVVLSLYLGEGLRGELQRKGGARVGIVFSREEILSRLHRALGRGEAILAVGAGIGITAKFAERGGADLIVVYNSGLFRMHGIGSSAGNLPLGDANALVLEMGERWILPIVREVPVVAGIYGVDPTREMKTFLRQVAAIGYSGVINFPTVGRIDGTFRRTLEHMGLGYDKEVRMISVARGQGLFTMAYAFCEAEAIAMAEAGVDVLVAHVGLTAGGDVGNEEACSLEEATGRVETILRAGLRVKPTAIPLCHGGSIASPSDVAYVLTRTPARGFVAASSVERLPVERAIEDAVRSFKTVAANPPR